MLKRRMILLAGWIAILLLFSCDDDRNKIIPYVQVSFMIDLNIVNDLTVPGNSVYFPGPGFGGVIVYCEFQGSYYAYDAACTQEVSQTCILKNEGILATCPCCKSQFLLLSGAYPSSGPATFPLQSYHVSVAGSKLHVYN
jgi:nitrite reductase/ring-hydroxylating ferredoxin subunit